MIYNFDLLAARNFHVRVWFFQIKGKKKWMQSLLYYKKSEFVKKYKK
jgi:hypothetical protein